jgi:hypothetical protein
LVQPTKASILSEEIGACPTEGAAAPAEIGSTVVKCSGPVLSASGKELSPKQQRDRLRYLRTQKAQIAKSARWREENQELLIAYRKDHYQGHKEHIKAKTRKWAASHPEKATVHRKTHYGRHKDRVLSRNSRYAKTHNEVINLAARGRRAEEPQKNRDAVLKSKIKKIGDTDTFFHVLADLSKLSTAADKVTVVDFQRTETQP